MRPGKQAVENAQAIRWARRLARRTQAVVALHPEADSENVRHALILMELPPLERLQRSLIRGRALAINRK